MNHFSRECLFLYRWTSETRVLIILCAQNPSVTASGGFQQAEMCCVYISCTIIWTSAYTRTHLLVWQRLPSTYLTTQLFNTEPDVMLPSSTPVHRTAHLGLPSPLCFQGFLPWQQEACIHCTVYSLLCWILQYSFKIVILFYKKKIKPKWNHPLAGKQSRN